MTDTNLAIKADDSVVHEKDITVPEDPVDGMAGRSDDNGKPIHEGDESHKPEPPLLHTKLLAIAEAGQPTNLEEFIPFLVEKASQINAQDSTGKTALHIAIEHGLETEARCIIIYGGANVTIGDSEGQQPLYLACLKGNTELVNLLLGKIEIVNEIVNAAPEGGETPLAVACRKGHTDIVKTLLEKKADTKTSDEEKWTPLHWASWENHGEIVQHLLEEDTSNINAIETNENWTPLNAAAYRGHEKVVSRLLEKNADLYTPDSSNWTPLLTATRMQHPQTVSTVLAHKAGWKEGYLEIPDDMGNTPLHVASDKGYYEIASQLIDAGANYMAKDGQGMTPLHLASFHNHYKIVTLVLSKAQASGIDINAKADNGRTSLHLASLQGNELIVKALIKGYASINATDKSGMTPLHLASGANAEDSCHSDPDPVSSGPSGEDDTDWEKRSEEAKSGQHLSVVALLLRNEADSGIKAGTGETALHRAAAIGDKERTDILLESMESNDLSWEDWKDSPVKSALDGDDPQAVMGSLLAKQEIKEAPFWKHDGRFQVIKEVLENAKPQEIISLIIREVPRDDKKLPKGFESWGVIQWAAYERLPEELSELIDMSGPEEVYEMVHDALRATSQSINVRELGSGTSCEKLIQVFVALITNSERTTRNTSLVKEARNLVGSLISPPGEGGELVGKESNQGREQLFRPEQLDRNLKFNVARDSGMKILKGQANKAGKSLAILSKLQDILKDPPFDQISRTYKDKADYKLPRPRTNHSEIVQKAEATVVAFFKGEGESGTIRRNRTVQTIVYGLGPTEVVGRAIRDLIAMAMRGFMHFNSKLYAKKNLKLTWVHLPSTNMVWMNDLLTTIMHNESYQTREYSEVRSFFRDSWVEVPDRKSRSRMMRPQSVIRQPETTATVRLLENTASESRNYAKKVREEDDREESGANDGNENDVRKVEAPVADSREDEQKFYDDWGPEACQPAKREPGFVPASAIYMPYLAYSSHCGDLKRTQDAKLKEAHEDYESLLESYKGKDEQQHGSPTLDEWYYQFAQDDEDATEDQKQRNKSQVVSKYLKETEDGGSTLKPGQWTVVRVNQLWIWTISNDWVITATSSPFDNSPDTLVDEILSLLSKQAEYGGSRAQPATASELVPVIIDHCVGSYERRPSEYKRISIGQTFSHYINRIGRDETALFNDFRAWSPDEDRTEKSHRTWYRHTPAEHLLKLAKGRTAKTAASRVTVNRAEPKPMALQPYIQHIGAAIRKAKALCFHIKDVRDELSILKAVAGYQQIVQRGLDGKAVDESRLSSTYVVKNLEELDSIAERIQSAINTTLSLQQSEVANRQATEATKQGKTVMTFTFATVLFLPLSFLSSLFALDVASFQEAPAWAFYVIFFVSIGVSAILGFSVFYWDNIKRAMKMLFEIVEKAFEGDSKPPSRPPDVPEKEGTGSEGIEKLERPISVPSKSKGGEPGFMSCFRGRRRGADTDDIESHAAASRR